MAVSFNDVQTICQEAFYLIRQDASVLTNSNWTSGSPIEVAKCKLAIETAVNEVADAFKWNKITVGTETADVSADNVANWPRKLRNACVYCLARELSIPIAGRVEDMKTMDALYRDKLIQAKLTELNKKMTELGGDGEDHINDNVLSQLVANFRSDDAGLVTAYDVYSKRIKAVKTEAQNEAIAQLGLSSAPASNDSYYNLYVSMVSCLCVAKLAVPCGMDANSVQVKLQEYGNLVVECKRRQLEAGISFTATSGTFFDLRKEVMKTLDLTSEPTFEETKKDGTKVLVNDGLYNACCIDLYYARYGEKYGYDTNFVQAKLKEYEDKINEYRRKQLEDGISYDSSATDTNFYDCRQEVQKTLGLSSEPTDDGLFKGCVLSLYYSRYGERYGYDTNFVQLKAKEYVEKIAEYQRKILFDNTRVSAPTDAQIDAIVTELKTSFGIANPSDEQLELLKKSAESMYYERNASSFSGMMKKAFDEVVDTLGISSDKFGDNLVISAAESLCYARNGEKYGYDANFVQLKEQEYATKLVQYRKIQLDTARTDDEVLSQLVSNFKGDDAALANAYTAYSKRSAATKTLCEDAAKDTFGVTDLSGRAQAAANCMAVAKLAPAFGLDSNFSAVQMQIYDRLLAEHKQDALASDADTESSTAFTDCLKEVKYTLGVPDSTSVDAIMKAAARALVFVRHGTKAGYDANFINVKEQEYATKIQEWRKVKLNEELAANTDPVLTQLIANFRADDAGLINAYEIYTKRSTVAKDTSAIEINAAHDWTTKFESTATTHPAYPAWLVLACAKLASACGFAADRVQLYMAEYDKLLSTARASDLEAAKRAITDADTKEVLSMISTNFVAGDATMPRSITAITDRIDALKCSARKEVILSQDWNFAKVVDVQDCCEQQMCHVHDEEVPYVYEVQYPVRALRLIAVYGHAGELDEWKVEDGFIKSRQPITKIKYTADVTDFNRWSEFAKRAYIHRLAADVARTVMNNPTDADRQERLYSLALENAKLRDTRESSTPTDAWGGNHHVMAMQGGFRPHVEEWR